MCKIYSHALHQRTKSLCIANGIRFPKTHNIDQLIDLLKNGGIIIPDNINEGKILTNYATETRYPEGYEPVDEEEYQRAVRIADDIIKWVESEIRGKYVG